MLCVHSPPPVRVPHRLLNHSSHSLAPATGDSRLRDSGVGEAMDWGEVVWFGDIHVMVLMLGLLLIKTSVMAGEWSKVWCLCGLG
jgi:hypothetical protein